MIPEPELYETNRDTIMTWLEKIKTAGPSEQAQQIQNQQYRLNGINRVVQELSNLQTLMPEQQVLLTQIIGQLNSLR